MLIIIEEETQERNSSESGGNEKRKPSLPHLLTMSENSLKLVGLVFLSSEEATLRFQMTDNRRLNHYGDKSRLVYSFYRV